MAWLWLLGGIAALFVIRKKSSSGAGATPAISATPSLTPGEVTLPTLPVLPAGKPTVSVGYQRGNVPVSGVRRFYSEGWTNSPTAADVPALFAACYSGIRVVTPARVFDSTTAPGQAQIRAVAGIEPQGPKHYYFTGLVMQGTRTGNKQCPYDSEF